MCDSILMQLGNMAIEVRVMSTFREVWIHVIAFLEGSWKIGLRQAVVQVSCYHHQPSVLSSMRNWQRRQTNKTAIFGTSEALWPWPWPWIRSRSHWCAYLVKVYPHTKLRQNWKNFLWMYGWMYGRTDTPEFSKSIRPGCNDLKNWSCVCCCQQLIVCYVNWRSLF